MSAYAICPSCKRATGGASPCPSCGAITIVGVAPAPKPGNAARTLALVSLVGLALLLAVVVPVLGVPLLALIALVALVKTIARLV